MSAPCSLYKAISEPFSANLMLIEIGENICRLQDQSFGVIWMCSLSIKFFPCLLRVYSVSSGKSYGSDPSVKLPPSAKASIDSTCRSRDGNLPCLPLLIQMAPRMSMTSWCESESLEIGGTRKTRNAQESWKKKSCRAAWKGKPVQPVNCPTLIGDRYIVIARWRALG